MTRLKKTMLWLVALIFLSVAGLWSYVAVRVLTDFDLLVACSTGTSVVPQSLCRYYLFNFGDQKQLAAYNQKISDGQPHPDEADGRNHYHESVPCDRSVNPFWEKFRAAVLKEDMAALVEMTELPLRLQRFTDGERIILTRENFAREFPRLLNSPPGGRYKYMEESMKEWVDSISELDATECGDLSRSDQLDIGHWRFNMRPQGWRLVAIQSDVLPAPIKD